MVENQANERDLHSKLMEMIGRVEPLNEEAMKRADQHLLNLTKPPGSLGKLEDIATQLAGITGELHPDLSRKAIVVMAADHGVCEEGVSAFPAEVTPQMVLNFLAGGAAVNVLARQAGADVRCVDIGVNAELSHPQLISRKLMNGTCNIAKGPAMSRETAIEAVLVGIKVVEQLWQDGYRMFATGDMGIGNTTASSAVLAVLSGGSPEDATGRGTGINDERFAHKMAIIRRAIETNEPNSADPIDVLSKVGGLEIAGLAGVIIGAAAHRCPVVIDGFISSAAALLAAALCENSVHYMIGSHLSNERAHGQLLKEIGLSPVIHLSMRLGEGTGAALCFHFIEAAQRIMSEMATFDSAGVSRG
ncbi:nicotinate-nucleotide-dimethylbenzimidazole phosphoribosyltransferase [Paenibacillus cellulosilyticus]|uniref:Nicotinate-nucleotide--dimethylbenzimidazole phosphoribosyltransferase n=1 Tax=Paenibacillus cellulosilyticus TaxID=375489 RepID=A0A2V2Z6M2_9BACL|nr:nicotinate-nucleotide--dimethylbenzimidazole phosphoribosyltransferase [Paenibacillus cellulosilyticus]PWW06500.1 nicotinate-nucleotide-dimethylbenzimidazole phosphoribosyltransferase [Paenibacillus cellulosilyticus]QKS46161.1 nicotinate-nucleotide--dimethylbenzimidazole phosphoribosyltransferase [Paenibacillus cellulosilyticus]